MNNSRIFFLLLLATSTSIYGSPACLDNSWHLEKRYDSKNFHSVDCNCPCEKQYKIMEYRGKCSKCEHFRVPKQIEFISCARTASKTESPNLD